MTRAPTHDPLEGAVVAAAAATGQSQSRTPQFTIAAGRRASADRTHLRGARRRRNLTILTNALAQRIVLDGATARGVAYARAGSVEIAPAEREVL